MKNLNFLFMIVVLVASSVMASAQEKAAAAPQAVTFSQVQLDKISAMSAEELEAYLASLTEDEWVALFKAVNISGNKNLENKIMIAAQSALNKMDKEKAQSIAEHLNKEIPGLNFGKTMDGGLTIFTIPSLNSTGPTLNIKTNKLSKGTSKY